MKRVRENNIRETIFSAIQSTVVGLLLLSGSPLTAQPAIYTGDTLTIPQGAVFADQQAVFYENIQLRLSGDGSFAIESSAPRSLVSVDSVSANVSSDIAVQVSLTVAGNKSVPCVELLTPAVLYSDRVFAVALAESELGPAESCIAVIDPFETTIPLNVEGLAAGTYFVRVNGVESEFTLQTDA